MNFIIVIGVFLVIIAIAIIIFVVWSIKNTPIPSKKGRSLNTLKEIIRTEHAGTLKTIDYGHTNLSPDIQKKVLEEIIVSLSKGENPKNCKAKNYISDDFEWAEYDEWYKKFYDAGGWPPLWEDAAECFCLEQECEDISLDELLGELDKAELLTIAERFNLRKIKSKSAKFIYNKLLEVVKPDDEETKQIIRSKIKENARKSLVAEKKFLYQHTLMAIAVGTHRLNEWKGYGEKKVEFSPGPDTCQFCEELAGVYMINKSPIPGKDTHPGCRCSFTLADDNREVGASKRNEIKARYESGEWPMKRCPHCSEWTEGNSVKCRNCSKELQ